MAKRKYGPADVAELRRKLETAKMNRRHFEGIVKRAQKELDKAKAGLSRAMTQAAESHAILKYGLGVRDVEL